MIHTDKIAPEDPYAIMARRHAERDAARKAAEAEAQARAKRPAPPSTDVAPATPTDSAPVRSPIELVAPPANLMAQVFPDHEFASFPRLPMKCCTAFISEGGAGKSTLILDCMLHVAAGLHFLGMPVKQGRVVYLSAEDDQEEVWRRVQKLLRKFESEDATRALRNFSLIDAVGAAYQFVGKDAGGMVRVGKIVDHIAAAAGQAVLIAIDTLSRVNGGEENSNEVMSRVVAGCERIAQRTGAAVVILHHTAKSAAREGIADLHSGRGGSALGDNARSVMRLMPARPEDVRDFSDISAEAVAAGDILRLIHAKASYARKAGPVWLRRCVDGTLEEFEPATKDQAKVAERMLHAFVSWWIANDRKPFSKSSVIACRGRLKEIWPAGVSEGGARSFFDARIADNTLLPAPETKLKGGALAFTFNEATAEALLAKATEGERLAAAALEANQEDGT